jgi:hypothetical protein
VRGDFAAFEPVTARELLSDGANAGMPAYYADFFYLTQCDVLAISNSMFSFNAALLNETAGIFARPVLGSANLVPFDPWDSKPILRREMYNSVLDRYRDYLRQSYIAGGLGGVQKSLIIRIPRFWLARGVLNIAAGLFGKKLSFHFDSY